MRDFIRFAIFAAVVGGIAFTIAPPVRTSASAGSNQPDRRAAVPSDDLTGTYAGTITPDAAGEAPDGGVIVIGRVGERLSAAAGPDSDTQFPADQVAETANGLQFDVALPGDGVRVVTFTLSVDGPRMEGTVSLLRDGVRSTGRVAFVRQ